MRHKTIPGCLAAMAALALLSHAAAAEQAYTVRSIMPKIHRMVGSTVSVTSPAAVSGTGLVLIPDDSSGLAIDVSLKKVPENELNTLYDRCDVMRNCTVTVTGMLAEHADSDVRIEATRVVVTKSK